MVLLKSIDEARRNVLFAPSTRGYLQSVRLHRVLAHYRHTAADPEGLWAVGLGVATLTQNEEA
jgi:hypothetical protein